MSLQKALVAQFHRPHGVLGMLAGRIMAKRESNLARNRWTVELLDLQGDDRVLELGPGPGVTLGLILERISTGKAVGIDHSATMLAQCAKRNRPAISSGRLTLVEGSFTELPELSGPFDKIIAVNALQFDGLSVQAIRPIVGLLADDGIIAVTFQPRGQNPTDEQALAFGNKVADLLQRSGLAKTRIETLPLRPVCAVCVLGQRA